jgi:hypothetical protein
MILWQPENQRPFSINNQRKASDMDKLLDKLAKRHPFLFVISLFITLAMFCSAVKIYRELSQQIKGIKTQNIAPNPSTQIVSELSGTAFENPYNRNTKICKFRTFIKIAGLHEIKPALIEVCAEEGITPNGGPMSAHAIQYGYSICVSPAMTEISSRMQESLECQMGFHMIQRVIIHYADTSSADWKNAKGTVSW